VTLSTGKRPYQIKNTKPVDPNLLPVGKWSTANRSCYQRFRKWMVDTGFSPYTVQSYVIGARFVLGFLKKPYWEIDPYGDIEQVWVYFQQNCDSLAKIVCYRKGFFKFRQYLSSLQNHPGKPRQINWDFHLKGLPEEVAATVGEYVQHCQRNWNLERRYETTNTFLSHLTCSLRWMAANLSLPCLAAITPQAWYAYVKARLTEGISPVSLNGELRVLWGLLHFAQDQGIPVCERTFKISKLRAGVKVPKDVPIDQLCILLAEIERTANSSNSRIRHIGVMDRAWVLLMLHSGLRSGEIRSLRFSDLDLTKRKIKIEQSKGLNDRFVYLSEAVCDVLEAYLAIRGPSDALPETVFVFRQQPLSRGYCGSRLNTYGKKCGVRITPHQLRHTCATLLLNEGLSIISVQRILGHQYINTTLRYARVYDGTAAADYFKAMNRIEGRFTTPSLEEQVTFSPKKLLCLLEELHDSTLNSEQKAMVAVIQEGVFSLVNHKLYLPWRSW
jgi:site-specific recombinase XerD